MPQDMEEDAMAKTVTKRSKATSTLKRARAVMSREARAAYGEIQQGVKHLEKSIAQIQRDARKAERKIESDARAKIGELRKDARTQLAALQSKQREATRILKALSGAAGDAWHDIKHSADAILADAREAAVSVVDRFRRALSS